MAASNTVSLRIEKLVAGGEGLAFHEGKAVFVPLALPGETVVARLAKSKKDYGRAELVEVLEPSRHRVDPPCPVYDACGGCNLMHLSYTRQVEEKSLIVTEAFTRTAKVEVGELSAVPSLPFGYRNRMQFHFTKRGRVGLMRRASAETIEIPGCPISLRPIQTWIEEGNGTDRAFKELESFVHGKDRFLVFGYGDEVWLEGKHGIVEVKVGGEPVRFHLKGFFQSNLYLLDYFIPDAIKDLSGDRAADLYCGVGVFARRLAVSYSSLVCVEQNPYSLDLARVNVPGKRHEFVALAVEDWISSPSAASPFDLVLVDPPRAGLSPQVRQWLLRSRPRTIVYASCDPVTLARDAGDLVRGGYELGAVKVYDFYPQTSHVECHARFTLA